MNIECQKSNAIAVQCQQPAIPPLAERKKMDYQTIANNPSFVGRAHRLSDGQRRGLENGMQQFGYEYNPHTSLDLLIPKNHYEKIIIDIGFGNGETLLHMATQQKDTLFIGIETYTSGVGALFVKSLPLALQNIRVFQADAVKVLFHMIAEHSIDSIHIFFPDPWHKSRHHKRRLLQYKFVQLCLHLLRENGVLWIVTDWEAYAVHIDEVLSQCSKEHIQKYETNASAYFHKNEVLQNELESQRPQTKFEQRGINRGHRIYPFVYEKRNFGTGFLHCWRQ